MHSHVPTVYGWLVCPCHVLASRLVEEQPLLLVTQCVEEVLDDLRRLMPGQRAEQLLAADPDW